MRITIYGGPMDDFLDDDGAVVDIEASRRERFIELAEERLREAYPGAAIAWERGNGLGVRVVVETDATLDEDAYLRLCDEVEEAVRWALHDLWDHMDEWLVVSDDDSAARRQDAIRKATQQVQAICDDAVSNQEAILARAEAAGEPVFDVAVGEWISVAEARRRQEGRHVSA